MVEETKEATSHIGRSYSGEQGSYRIIDSIGAGGMGTVTLAEDEKTGRNVAVKFLHDDLSGEGSSSQGRFEREIRVLQDLKAFRGIVQIEDWGRTPKGIMFLVMEYVSAPTLDRIIEEHPNGLSQIDAVQIIVEILSVLEPIHHRKFVHRDLKPHNICVYQEPLAVRLLDFGLSKPYLEGLGYDKVTRRMQGKGNEIPGSPHYMAVEQFLRPKEVDLRTDLYATGIILYELLAGIPPYRGIYLQDILKQHKENEAPPIDNCADGGAISYRLQAVIDKALAKKSESRYQSAAEFKEALFDVLNMLNKRRRPRKELDGDFRIIRKIGQGGNSEVFEGEEREDGSRIAMKIAREGSSDWDEETLMNEADRALKHDNIVRVLAFGSYESRPVLIMELLEGGTLEHIMEEHKDSGLPESIFYKSMVDICRGLHHAHQSNIVHRDVKPGNMLRTLDGRTKVCDFGIAKRFEQSGDEVQGAKNTTLAKGTAQYISPEQCDLQGRVDRRADLYCLGVMMYEMLSGKLPFTEGILIMQHLQMDPPPLLVKGNYSNPDALCKIVGRCMQKDPAYRFQSMKELAQELVRVSKLEPQKKPHKAVTLSTVPEEWANDPTRTGVAPSRGPVTATSITDAAVSIKKLVLVGLPIVAVLVFVIVEIMGGGGGEPSITPDGRDAVAMNTERDEVRGLIDQAFQGEDLAQIQSSLESIRGFEFELLEPTDEQRSELANSLAQHAKLGLAATIADRAALSDRIGLLGAVKETIAFVHPEDSRIAELEAFVTALEEYGTAVGAVTLGSDPPAYAEWEEGRDPAMRLAANTFATALNTEPDSVIKFVERQASLRLENNVQAVVLGADRRTDVDVRGTDR